MRLEIKKNELFYLIDIIMRDSDRITEKNQYWYILENIEMLKKLKNLAEQFLAEREYYVIRNRLETHINLMSNKLKQKE